MISPNNHAITWEQIQKLKVGKSDDAGYLWKGIRHADFLNTLHIEMGKKGFRLKTSRYAYSKWDDILVASFDVKIPNTFPPEGHVFSLGVITSNKRRQRSRIAIGTTHFQTDTGFVSGLITLGKRTKEFDLTAGIQSGLDEYLERVVKIEQVIHTLKETELDQKKVDKIIMRASRSRPIFAQPAWEHLGATLKLYQSTEGKTAWDLMFAFAQSIKKSTVTRQILKLVKFRQVIQKATKEVKV